MLWACGRECVGIALLVAAALQGVEAGSMLAIQRRRRLQSAIEGGGGARQRWRSECAMAMG
jgi:hypothetical protein